ncbi:MAG: C10 family peptidase, partial [Muribaculaceae bacterium]|nr:C10 family peptidase [Muribaculaceae bacterium]
MRKFLIFFLAVHSFLIVNARQVTSQQAADIASELYNSRELKIAKNLTQVSLKSSNGRNGNQPFYIFNIGEDDGFVIISGDDRMKKVLAYSRRGHINSNNLPPQLQYILEQYALTVSSLSDSAPRHESWDENSLPSEVVDLKTARWNQWEPFNLKAPEYDDKRAPIGCVATALSIIMKHNQFPTKASKNFIHQWRSSGTPYSYDFGKMNIDYTLLKDEYLPDEQLSDDESEAISELMFAAAAAMNMQFSPFSSSATVEDKPRILREIFGFSSECQYIARVYFSDDQWNNLIKEQLDNGLPVMYSGRNGIFSGHTFVLDGYDSEGYYHINWGWGGLENGYFSIDGEMNHFKDYQSMIINLKPSDHPAQDSEKFSRQWIDGDTRGLGTSLNGYGAASGLNIDVENIEPNVPFNAVLSVVLYPSDYNGLGTLALIDENDNVIETCKNEYGPFTIEFTPQIWEHELNSGKDWYVRYRIYFRDIFFTVPISDSYRIAYVAKDEEDSDWKLVHSTLDAPGSLPVSGNKVGIPEVVFNIHGDSDKVFVEEDNLKHMYLDDYEFNVNVIDGIAAVYVDGKLHHYNTCYLRYKSPYFGLYKDKYVVDIYYMPYSDLISKEYNVETPGSLSSLIEETDKDKIGTIKINGKINAADIETIGDLKFIRNIDLETASFVAEGNNPENFFPEMTWYVYDRSFIPPYETI